VLLCDGTTQPYTYLYIFRLLYSFQFLNYEVSFDINSLFLIKKEIYSRNKSDRK